MQNQGINCLIMQQQRHATTVCDGRSGAPQCQLRPASEEWNPQPVEREEHGYPCPSPAYKVCASMWECVWNLYPQIATMLPCVVSAWQVNMLPPPIVPLSHCPSLPRFPCPSHCPSLFCSPLRWTQWPPLHWQKSSSTEHLHPNPPQNQANYSTGGGGSTFVQHMQSTLHWLHLGLVVSSSTSRVAPNLVAFL